MRVRHLKKDCVGCKASTDKNSMTRVTKRAGGGGGGFTFLSSETEKLKMRKRKRKMEEDFGQTEVV